MKVLIVGAGPAGLALAWHLKRSSPACRIDIIEQRLESESAGLGITLPRAMAEEIGCADGECVPIERSCTWYQGGRSLTTSIDLIAVARDIMIARLRRRCESAGVRISFNRRIGSIREALAGNFDLIVGADGVNSAVRLDRANCFGSSIRRVNLHHAWLAVPKLLDRTLTTIFQERGSSLFTAWTYPFDKCRSAVIVQASASAVATHGLVARDGALRVADIFADAIEGNPLLGESQLRWSRFVLLKNRTWHVGNTVLIGDAAHTAHFCRGYGTADALGDALSLSQHIAGSDKLELTLEAYERERMPRIALHQSAALSASNWHERVVRRREEGNLNAVIESIEEAAAFTPSNVRSSTAGEALRGSDPVGFPECTGHHIAVPS